MWAILMKKKVVCIPPTHSTPPPTRTRIRSDEYAATYSHTSTRDRERDVEYPSTHGGSGSKKDSKKKDSSKKKDGKKKDSKEKDGKGKEKDGKGKEKDGKGKERAYHDSDEDEDQETHRGSSHPLEGLT